MAEIAWVTGAGKGIGRAVARELAARGWTVAASARTAADLDSLAVAAAALPGRIATYGLDVTDQTAVNAAVRRIETDHGPIRLAILNAGTHLPVSALRFDTAAVRTLVETNLMGTVYCLGALLPLFTARKAARSASVSSTSSATAGCQPRPATAPPRRR